MKKTKVCPICKTEFETPYPMKKYDKYECAKQARDKQNKKSRAKTAKKRKKLKKLTPLPKLNKRVQIAFNKWIRNRDTRCISCGKGVDHAGHYISQGSCSYLRYNEENCNGQCMPCNNFKHGNLINYRIGLVKKIGEERVVKLEESQNIIKKWTRQELMELLDKYET